MKINIGPNDCLKDKASLYERDFLLLLEDDEYFEKTILKTRSEIKISDFNISFENEDDLIDKIDKITFQKMISDQKDRAYDKSWELSTEYDIPFEYISSLYSLIRYDFWTPPKLNNEMSIITSKEMMFMAKKDRIWSDGSIYIRIPNLTGITKISDFIKNNYKKIKDSFPFDALNKDFPKKVLLNGDIKKDKQIFQLRKSGKRYFDIANELEKIYGKEVFEDNLRIINKRYKEAVEKLRCNKPKK